MKHEQTRPEKLIIITFYTCTPYYEAYEESNTMSLQNFEPKLLAIKYIAVQPV